MSNQYVMSERVVLKNEPTENPLESADGSKPTQDVKVVSLEIDENDDFGTDPYNRTGSFCAPDFEKE